MSKLQELINELCPDGVTYEKISAVCDQFNGMTGVSNKWADNGNCRFIDYLNAYNNLKIDTTKLPYATVKNTKQNILSVGDILCTSASETPDECAISSVIENELPSGIFMDDHLFGIRIKDKKKLNPMFLNYYFRSKEFRLKINKAVRGVTRFYISNPDFMKLSVPVPPLPVQEEIVRILDKMTGYVTELKAELKARKMQYEYYRDNIFNINEDVKYYPLKEVCISIKDGMHNLPKENSTSGNYPILSAQNINNGNIYYDAKRYVEKEVFEKENRRTNVEINDVLLTIVATIGRTAVVKENKDFLLQRSVCSIKCKDLLLSYFLKYFLDTTKIQNYMNSNAHGSAQAGLYLNQVAEIKVPVPSIKRQHEIIEKLSSLDTICNNLTSGLPAEIEARQKQYEYYRDKLLSFQKLENEEC